MPGLPVRYDKTPPSGIDLPLAPVYKGRHDPAFGASLRGRPSGLSLWGQFLGPVFGMDRGGGSLPDGAVAEW